MKRRGFLLALGLAGTVLASAVTVEAAVESRSRRTQAAHGKRRHSRSGFGPLPLAGSGMTAPF